MSGATYPPDVALRAGLVDEVVEPAAFARSRGRCRRNTGRVAAAGVRSTKRQIRQPVTDAMERHAPRIDKVAEEIWTSPATIEHIRGYVARTFKKG